ncbi:MAG: sugar phosphate nucleotidyltransferase [Oscillospiraceae bacterium]
MQELTLVVLAAGMGSRFGSRIKQLEPLGPNGELMIDYSIHDALRVGFNRVVFIIRHDIEELFKETIGSRIEKLVDTAYVYQSVDFLPTRQGDFPSRVKPWGTAQALYCCKDVVKGGFAVINSDDFYSPAAFADLADFLRNPNADACSVDFLLKNTLSDNGTVNRGICRTNSNGFLTEVLEHKQIIRGADGVIRGKYEEYERILEEDSTASMNMWGFCDGFMSIVEERFAGFLENLDADEPKAELTIAQVVGQEIEESGYRVLDIPTKGQWFGITYESDVAPTRAAIQDYIDRGIYSSPLKF